MANSCELKLLYLLIPFSNSLSLPPPPSFQKKEPAVTEYSPEGTVLGWALKGPCPPEGHWQSGTLLLEMLLPVE